MREMRSKGLAALESHPGAFEKVLAVNAISKRRQEGEGDSRSGDVGRD
jgi:hypothetical protein